MADNALARGDWSTTSLRKQYGDEPLNALAAGVPMGDVASAWPGQYGDAVPQPNALMRFMASQSGQQLGILANFLGSGVRAPARARVPAPIRAPEGPSSAPPQGIRAYHGSPHDFDRFDMSKIGSGEGAQAFGHGLYFAESEGVAKSYRDNLSGRNIAPPKMFGKQTEADLMARAENAVSMANYDTAHAAQRLRSEANYFKSQGDGESATKLAALADRVETGDLAFKRPGRMYEVKINADPEHFLDWDKPLSQQSEKVRKAIGYDLSPEVGATAHKYATELEDIYGQLGRMQGGDPKLVARANQLEDALAKIDPKGLSQLRINSLADGPETTARLREAGIPGIRYKDAMSRGSEGGTSNYVVFDDALVSILRKYGLLPPAALGAASMASQSNQEQ